MTIRLLGLVLYIATYTATPAQDLGASLSCQGIQPTWQLDIDGDDALFDFQRASELDLMLTTQPQSQPYPRAMTFVGRGDSAILILDQEVCDPDGQGDPFSAIVLTQRGQTPLLLTGCCRPA